MTYPLVRELASDGIPVTVTCRVLQFSPQGYYQWLKKPCSKRDYDNAHLTNALLDLHRDDPTFGYRFMADELELLNEFVGERRVWRLCSEMSIFSAFTKKGKSGKKPGAPVHDDLVQRDFSASRMNELWFTDITEHATTSEGKLYMASIEDAFSGRIVGYSIGPRMTRHLACAALRNAIALRDHDGTICHSDRGSQGEFNRSLQHLRRGGANGKAIRLGQGVLWEIGVEVARRTVASPRGPETLLARDRQRLHERRGSRSCRSGTSSRVKMVPPKWRHAIT